MDFSIRSRALEMIDSPDEISDPEMDRILRAFEWVNRLLGGRRSCLSAARTALLQLLIHRSGEVPGPLRVLDVGCGGADIATALVDWGRRRGLSISVVALDFSNAACRLAALRTRTHPEVLVVQGDAFRLPFKEAAYDLVLCSTLLHHFSDDQIVGLLRTFQTLARERVIVTDLHRHPFAYWGIRLLSRLFSRSESVRNDGPLSVLKGFRREELDRILGRAEVETFRLRWRWAFRWVLEIEGGRWADSTKSEPSPA